MSEALVVRIFISYRRDDTAGHAGRLFDALVSRFGSANVFQDVMAIAPGVDFGRETSAAIGRCDVVLVVIGNRWLTLAGPAGRRLDDQNDYVRLEVAAALSSDIPVVPVLVGGASLPSANELPDDLESLALRQAVVIRDDAWHQDVDALIRRLRHEEVAGSGHWRWSYIAAGAAVVTVAVVTASLSLRGGGADGGSDGELASCPQPTGSWLKIDVDEAATTEVDTGDSRLVFTVESVEHDVERGRVFLEVEVRNVSDPTSTEVPYYNEELFAQLLVDGLSQGPAQCISVTGDGDRDLEPGHRVIGVVGFDLTEDPTDLPLVLELFSGDHDIFVT